MVFINTLKRAHSERLSGDVGCLGRDHGVSGHKVVRCGSACFFGLGSLRVAQLWRIYYVWYRLKLTFSDVLGTCAL